MALRAMPHIPSLLPRLPTEHALRLRLPQSIAAASTSILQLSSLFVSTSLSNTLPSPSSILRELWDGLLRAVPKKKTSYSKTRSRQMAGKGLKDYLAVVKCPSCGRPKKAHYLCPYCVEDARAFMASLAHEGQATVAEKMDAVNKQLSEITSLLKPGRRSPKPEVDGATELRDKPNRRSLQKQTKDLKTKEEELRTQFGDRVETTRIQLKHIKLEAKEPKLLAETNETEVPVSLSTSDIPSSEKTA